jgi:transposase
MNEFYRAVPPAQPPRQLCHRFRRIADITEVTNLTISAPVGDGHGERLLVNIQADKCVNLAHAAAPLSGPDDPGFGSVRRFSCRGKGHVIWPQAKEESVALTPAQLSMLLEGIDWRAPRRTWAPEAAG